MSGPTAELGRCCTARDGTENILRSPLRYGEDAGLEVWGKL